MPTEPMTTVALDMRPHRAAHERYVELSKKQGFYTTQASTEDCGDCVKSDEHNASPEVFALEGPKKAELLIYPILPFTV